MFDVSDFLDRAKAAAGVDSDYALAVKVLGYKKASTVYNWRSGLSAPDVRAVLKLCALTGDDPEHVVACLQSMRAANDDESEFWQHLAQRLKQTGAASISCLAVLAMVFLALHADTVQAAPDLLNSAGWGLCIMSTVCLLRIVWRLARLCAVPHPPQPGRSV
jgi:hypothetical protein